MIVDAVIERGKDGTYSIYMDKKDFRLNYLVTGSGKTIDDAKNDFLQGYDDMKEFFNAKGKDFVEVEFNYVIDVQSVLLYYSSLFSLAGLSKITGISKGQLSHYVTGLNKPNKKNENKILEGFRTFANDMTQFI